MFSREVNVSTGRIVREEWVIGRGGEGCSG